MKFYVLKPNTSIYHLNENTVYILFLMANPSTTEGMTYADNEFFRTLCEQLAKAMRRLKNARRQLTLLAKKETGLMKRYLAAKTAGKRVFIYPLRLRVEVVKGVLHMYQMYAIRLCATIEGLQEEVMEFMEVQCRPTRLRPRRCRLITLIWT